MTHQDIIIGIGVLVGLYLLPKTKPAILKVILIGFVLSYGLTFFEQKLLLKISFFSFYVLVFGFSIHQAINGKWTNSIIAIFTFLLFLSNLLRFPFISFLQFLMIIPVVLYIWILLKKRESEDGLSILTILACYELSEFLTLVEYWTQLD